MEVRGEVIGGLTHGDEGRGREERVFFGEGATCGGGGKERREDFPAIHGEMTTSAFRGMHGCLVVVEERQQRCGTKAVTLLKQGEERIFHISAAIQSTKRGLSVVAHVKSEIR